MLLNDGVGRSWAAPVAASVGMTERGLICEGAVLARMTKACGRAYLAVDEDADRTVALLSAAAGHPVARDSVLPHIRAASDYWQSGDKALANLRLVFAKLPRPGDGRVVERLRLAEELLDDGLAPNAFMKACWPEAQSDFVKTYNPDEPRRQSAPGRGEWTLAVGESGTTVSSDRQRIVIAEHDDRPIEAKQLSRDLLQPSVPTAYGPHLHLNDPLAETPGGFGSGQIKAAAKAAVDAVGPGRGPVYGTAVHTEFKARVRALGRPDIHTEKSYLNGEHASYGTPGSVRADVVEGTIDRLHTVFDLKTGSAKLTKNRIEQLRNHIPDGQNIEIHEVHP